MGDPKPAPRCGECRVLAADMAYLDAYWAEDLSEPKWCDEEEKRRERVEYVRHGEGTYNASTGRFWCDPCYIAIGMPMGVCP